MVIQLGSRWCWSLDHNKWVFGHNFLLPLTESKPQDIWRTWCFWRTRRPQRVINLSQETGYMRRELDLDKKVDVDPDNDVLDICKPTLVHVNEAVWLVQCVFCLCSFFANRIYYWWGVGPGSFWFFTFCFRGNGFSKGRESVYIWFSDVCIIFVNAIPSFKGVILCRLY